MSYPTTAQELDNQIPLLRAFGITDTYKGDNTVQTYIISDTEAAFLLGDILLQYEELSQALWFLC